MIELRENQIIQTTNGTNYILKHVLSREGGVIAVNEDGYDSFIKFRDFKIILDPNMEEGGTNELC